MIFTFVLLILSLPVGLLIAWLARDELLTGRKWFVLLAILGLISGGWFMRENEIPSMFSSFFITIMAAVSYWKSFDRRWTTRLAPITRNV